MSVTAVPLQPVNRSAQLWLGAGIASALVLAGALACWRTEAVIAAKGTNERFLAWNHWQWGVHTTASGLQYQVLKEGDGPHPTDNDVVWAKYTGRLRDGSVFGASDKQPQPFPVKGMIPGFSEALKLMQKGGRYRLWIKPELGYGAQTPTAAIPPNAVLIFDIEPVGIEPATVFQQQMQQQMFQQRLQEMLQQQGGGGGAPPPDGGPGPGPGPGGQ